jgi:hypothetical protein
MRDPEDRAEFSKAMAALGENYRQDVADAQFALFWRLLSDLSIEAFQRAVVMHIQSSRFFPTVAELRQHITPQIDHVAAAVTAFEQVIKTSTHDARTGPRWSIRRVAQAVGAVAAEAFMAAGGSSAFEHELGERDLPFLRKRFVESYVVAAEAQVQGRLLACAAVREAIGTGPLEQLVRQTSQALSLPRSV